MAERRRTQARGRRPFTVLVLWAAMLALVGPLLQSETELAAKGGDTDLPRAQRLALLAELLALNFHEHFELGPLLRYVDTLPGQTEEARTRLRSTSRRVISRQLAPLLSKANGADGRNPAFLEISLNSDGSEPADKLLSCAAPAAPDTGSAAVKPRANSVTLNCSSTAAGTPMRVISPDGRDSLQVNVRAVSWAAQTVGIFSVLLGANGESQAHTPPIEFTLSPYSFPFSDNTLLPSGNRFGIYLTRIDDIPGVARIMRLSFVWFPKDFVPPRERPFDLDVHDPAPEPVATEKKKPEATAEQ